MDNFLITHQTIIRLGVFIGLLLLLLTIELIIPYRKPSLNKTSRDLNNLAILIINNICIRIILPSGIAGISYFAMKHNLGFINYFHLSGTAVVITSILILDFAIYLQHLVFHYIPWLWKFHKVHHADLNFDVTTAVRFHPIEIILSTCYKITLIFVFGVTPAVIILFEIILNATAMFSHSNIKLPKPLDKLLRLIIITPNVHQIHHSDIIYESNHNFGFNFIWWDYLCQTYLKAPKLGYDQINFGISEFKSPQITQKLVSMLLIPFKKVHSS